MLCEEYTGPRPVFGDYVERAAQMRPHHMIADCIVFRFDGVTAMMSPVLIEGDFAGPGDYTLSLWRDGEDTPYHECVGYAAEITFRRFCDESVLQ